MTLLLEEIEHKRSEIYEAASITEQLFFDYLNGARKPVDAAMAKGEIDKICFAAFSTAPKSPDIEQIVERQRKASPVRGFHFSRGLIPVIAFSILNHEVQINELQAFFDTALPKERFIVSHIFPEFRFVSAPDGSSISSVLDLINDISVRDNATSLIAAAIPEATDLVDIYIVKQAYNRLLEIHPDTSLKARADALSQAMGELITVVEKRLSRLVNLGLACVLLLFPVSAGLFTIRYWDSLQLESKFVAAGFLWSAIPLILIVITHGKPEWKLSAFLLTRLGRTKEALIEYWFLRNGITLDWVRELLSDIDSKDKTNS